MEINPAVWLISLDTLVLTIQLEQVILKINAFDVP